MEVQCIKPYPKTKTNQTNSRLARTSNDQKVSQHPKKCVFFVPSTLTTSSMLAPNSKHQRNVSPTSSVNQTKRDNPLWHHRITH